MPEVDTYLYPYYMHIGGVPEQPAHICLKGNTCLYPLGACTHFCIIHLECLANTMASGFTTLVGLPSMTIIQESL